MSLFVLPVLQGVDFMPDAKEVIGLTALLSGCDSVGDDDDAVRLEALRLIDKELNIVYNHFQELPADCIISSALRTRLEYVVRMVHLFLKKSDNVQAQNLSSMNIHLLFELLKILEQRVDSEADNGTPDETFTTPFVESELRKHHAERNMDTGRTQWLEMCFTSVAMAVVAMLRKVPAAYTLLDLNLADNIALTLSSHWPTQCLGLRSVCSMLQYERMCDKEALPGNNSNDNNSINGSGIAAMQRRIDSFNNHHIVNDPDDPVIPTNIVNMLSKGKSSKQIAGNEATKRGSKSVAERRTSNNNMNTSSSSSKLTRVSTSAGSGSSGTADGSLVTSNMDNRSNGNNNINSMASSKGNRSNSMVLRKSVSSIQQGSFRALVQTNRAARCVDDICKSGYLRTIVALLLHNKEIIRKLAAEVLQLILDISTPSLSNNNNNGDPTAATFITDICACCVEQGLVAQLEYICQGIVIHHKPAVLTTAIDAATDRQSTLYADAVLYFPEGSIRTLCTTLLHHLVQEVDTHTTLLTSLTSAMLHSGNTKLRVNIFSGLMYLTGRCPAIGRKLCVPVADPSTAPITSLSSQPSNISTSNAPNTKSIKGSLTSAKTATINSTTSSKGNTTNYTTTTVTVANPTAVPATVTVTDITSTDSTLTNSTPRRTLFYDMLTTLARDATDFRSLLRVMIHFLEHTLKEIQPRSEGTIMNLTATTVKNTNGLVYKIEPMVLISDQTRTTRMICPPLSVIEQHSMQLAALVKNALGRQVVVAMESLQNRNSTTAFNNNNGTQDKEKHLMQALKGMDDSYLVTLEGAYNMWQEIFSHMSDSYLLQTSVPKISTIGLLECLFITTQFGIKTLGGKYSEALVQRLDNNNFLQIFRASVGLYFPPKIIVPTSISSKNSSSTDGSTDIDPAPLSLHLYQAVHCMKYLDMNMERVVTIWKPKDTTLIVDCVHRLVLCLFLSDD